MRHIVAALVLELFVLLHLSFRGALGAQRSADAREHRRMFLRHFSCR